MCTREERLQVKWMQLLLWRYESNVCFLDSRCSWNTLKSAMTRIHCLTCCPDLYHWCTRCPGQLKTWQAKNWKIRYLFINLYKLNKCSDWNRFRKIKNKWWSWEIESGNICGNRIKQRRSWRVCSVLENPGQDWTKDEIIGVK